MKNISVPGETPVSALKPPPGINADALDYWFAACESLRQAPDTGRAYVLQTYVRLCDERGIQPFSNSVNPNPSIQSFLLRRRKLYVRYLERTGLMEGVKIRRAPTKEAQLTDYGFSIRVEGWASVPDPYWFRRIKATPGWRFSLNWDKEHRCVVRVDPGLTIYVRNPNIRSPLTWYIGFEIHCPIVPKLKVYKSQSIIRELWDPVSQSIRSKELPQRRL